MLTPITAGPQSSNGPYPSYWSSALFSQKRSLIARSAFLWGELGRPSMQARPASTTAVATAVHRAAHQVLDSEPKILNDPLAVGLVEGSTEPEIRAREEELQQ